MTWYSAEQLTYVAGSMADASKWPWPMVENPDDVTYIPVAVVSVNGEVLDVCAMLRQAAATERALVELRVAMRGNRPPWIWSDDQRLLLDRLLNAHL